MRWRGWRNPVAWALAWAGLAVACGSADDSNLGDRPGFVFAGQTGSLVPSCGVAPLSADVAVPVGDAIAVLYAEGCPDEALASLALTAADARELGIRLEPLDEPGVFLVRADESLSSGEYRLRLPDGSPTLAVAEDAAGLPSRLGELRPAPEVAACADELTFEWTLDADVLAYAALLRLWVSVDGGPEQLWVDYGALELNADSGVAVLQLPRCGTSFCLSPGSHELRLRGEIAGEMLQPAPVRADFEVGCADAASPAFATSEAGPEASCALGGRQRWVAAGYIVFLALALAQRRLKRNRKQAALAPPPPDPRAR